ncbi:MAG: Malonyl-CoA O-methyltransferase BioC [Pseudomonadota bacterium]|jgi:hypothetical protein
MDKDPLVRTVDPKSMRLQLERRGLGRIQGHPLWQEAAERMRERLSYIRLEDGPVLQHGLADYGQSIDIAPASLQRIESMGLLAALADARGTLAYWARSLKPGGLLMFVTLGPDSFRSLALALGDTQQRVHVAGYPDMHHLGDALVGLGMTNPVMDAEWVDLTYSTAESALNDLRMLGGNPLVGRRQGLSGRAWKKKVLAALESLRSRDSIRIRIELVFGHAWAALPKSDHQPVAWHPRPPKNAAGSI